MHRRSAYRIAISCLVLLAARGTVPSPASARPLLPSGIPEPHAPTEKRAGVETASPPAAPFDRPSGSESPPAPTTDTPPPAEPSTSPTPSAPAADVDAAAAALGSAPASEPAPPPLPPEVAPTLPPDISEISQLSLEALMNQKVETATKTATGLRQIPNRVVVVTADEIRLRGYRYLIELVENLPGIQVMNFVEAETGAHVIVRGIWQNNKILVLYNGHKITSPEGKDFIFGRHDWSLANVRRVEFIFGPASALYGADAVSAVINIVPKDFQDLQGHHVEATLGYGINNTVEADAATGFRSDPLQIRVDGAFHHSSGPNFLNAYPDYYAPLRG
jgi:outer membrane receptor protein involved in Fe transport